MLAVFAKYNTFKFYPRIRFTGIYWIFDLLATGNSLSIGLIIIVFTNNID